MKLFTVCIVCSFSFFQNAKSQDSLQSRQVDFDNPVYAIKLYLNGGEHFKAKLMSIRDSSIYVFDSRGAKADPFHTTNIHDESNWKKYNYKLIASIKVHNNGLRALTVLTGLIVGITAGVLIASGHSSGTQYDGLLYAGLIILGGGIGAGSGVIIASSIEKIHEINGEWEKLEALKTTLKY